MGSVRLAYFRHTTTATAAIRLIHQQPYRTCDMMKDIYVVYLRHGWDGYIAMPEVRI